MSHSTLHTLLFEGGLAVEAQAALRWWQRLLLGLARISGLMQRVGWRQRVIGWCLPRGQQVCIVGADAVALGLAQQLCSFGRRVSVVTQGADFAADLAADRRKAMLEELHQLSVVMINHSRVQRIDGNSLLLDCDGADIDIPADLVILATAQGPEPPL